MIILSLVFGIVGLLFGIISLILGIFSLVKVLAMEKSTHSVHMVPVDEEIEKANKDWATSEEAIKKENKMYSEDLEDNMTEFAVTDDDKEIFSL